MHWPISPNLQLGEFLPADTSRLVEYLSDRQIYDQTLRIPHPYTEADAANWFRILAELATLHGHALNWAIRDGQNQLLGGIGLDPAGGDQSHRAGLGYWLGRPFWGQGIMPLAVQEVCRHAFKQLSFRKLEAHVYSFNTASARVLEKCGFVYEGCLRGHVSKPGRLIDVRCYGLLADEC